MKPLRIAMLTSFYYPHIGGTERYVSDLSRALVERGYQVTIFSHSPGPVNKKKYAPMEVVRIPALWIPYSPYAAILPIRQLLNHDILHSHAPPFFFINQVARIKSIPQVLTYHCDLETPEQWGRFKLPKLSRRILDDFFNKSSRTHLKGVDAVIATTQSYAETSPVLKDFPYKVIPLGISAQTFVTARKRLGLDAVSRDSREILYVGRLVSSKGLDFLMEAARLMRDGGLAFHLTIAGSGEDLSSLSTQVHSMRLEDHIRFAGAVNEDELYALYCRAAVLVLPSFLRLEAFGIVQLEALAMGLPVIASDLPGVSDVIKKSGGGWLVPPKDPPALAKTLTYALSHPEEREARGESGRNFIMNHYDWKNIALQFEELYRFIYERKKATSSRQ